MSLQALAYTEGLYAAASLNWESQWSLDFLPLFVLEMPASLALRNVIETTN
jgi:hypothetical protein